MLDIVMTSTLIIMFGYLLLEYFYFKSFTTSVYDTEDDKFDETIENEALKTP
jgi:hypothetical protein